MGTKKPLAVKLGVRERRTRRALNVRAMPAVLGNRFAVLPHGNRLARHPSTVAETLLDVIREHLLGNLLRVAEVGLPNIANCNRVNGFRCHTI